LTKIYTIVERGHRFGNKYNFAPCSRLAPRIAPFGGSGSAPRPVSGKISASVATAPMAVSPSPCSDCTVASATDSRPAMGPRSWRSRDETPVWAAPRHHDEKPGWAAPRRGVGRVLPVVRSTVTGFFQARSKAVCSRAPQQHHPRRAAPPALSRRIKGRQPTLAPPTLGSASAYRH
jgi:hypothetical protein